MNSASVREPIPHMRNIFKVLCSAQHGSRKAEAREHWDVAVIWRWTRQQYPRCHREVPLGTEKERSPGYCPLAITTLSKCQFYDKKSRLIKPIKGASVNIITGDSLISLI